MLTGILKFVCLAVAIVYTYVNVMRPLKGQGVGTFDIFVMGSTWAGFVLL